MVLFSILMIVLVLIALFVIAAIAIGGWGFIVVFGDVVVCGLLIALMIKLLINGLKN